MINELFSPSKEYSPLPFWFFNDVYDHDKTVRLFKDYVEKGVNGFVLHPRIGLPQNMVYLSEEYFAAVRDIVAIAHELDMTVILYDEGMYPSGSVCGQVVAENPAYKAKGLRLLTKEQLEELKAQTEASEKDEQPLEKQALTDKSLAGVKLVDVISTDENGCSLVYMETGGNIRGIHFGEDDGEPFAPPAADILDPAAVACFIRLTHDRYYEELSQYFGNTIIAMFTDEPSPVGRNARGARPWYLGLEKDLVARGGRVEELYQMFAKDGGNRNAKSFDIYHKLIKERLNKVFYGPLSEWCNAHGIGLCGHPEVSDDVREEFLFDIPGQDLIMRRVCPENKGLYGVDSVQAKLCADIAYLTGKRRNLNECFGVCSLPEDKYNLPEEDMVWMINWMGFRGTNLYVPHAFYYTYADKQRDERPPDVGPNSLFWDRYKQYSDYFKRISYLNTDSKIDTKIAVLCDNNRVPADEIVELYERQISFVYVPIELSEKLSMFEVVLDPLEISEKKTATVEEVIAGRKKYPGLRFVRRLKDNKSFALFCNEGDELWTLSQSQFEDILQGANYTVAYDLFTMEQFNLGQGIKVAPRQMWVLF